MAFNPGTGVPSGPVDAPNNVDVVPAWKQFFLTLWQRTGGAEGSPSIALDAISSIVGAMLTRGAAAWQALDPADQYKVLRMGSGGLDALPEWDTLDGNSFAAQGASHFFAGPSVGAPAIPVFRAIQGVDLPRGEYPGTQGGGNAAAGDVGEYFETIVAAVAAVPLVTGTIADIATLVLGAGDYDVWASIAITGAVTSAKGWISQTSITDPAAPNEGAYAQWGAGILCLPIGAIRQSLSVPATMHLSINPTFSGAVSAYGALLARRRR